jgi:hypothetical protein
MRKRLCTKKLASQIREDLWTTASFLMQKFYRDVAIVLGKIAAVSIHCFEYGTHTAAAQPTLKNVPISQYATNFRDR